MTRSNLMSGNQMIHLSFPSQEHHPPSQFIPCVQTAQTGMEPTT